MDHMTTYLKNKVLDQELQGAYVALFNNDLEVNKANYTRQAINFIGSSEGQTSNDADIVFPIPGEAWGSITHIGLFDSQTGGNLLFKSPAELVKNIDVSNQYKIPKNYLIVRLR